MPTVAPTIMDTLQDEQYVVAKQTKEAGDRAEYELIQDGRLFWQAECNRDWKESLAYKERQKKLFPPNDFIALPEKITLFRKDLRSPVIYFDNDLSVFKPIYQADNDGNEAREQLWIVWRGIHQCEFPVMEPV